MTHLGVKSVNARAMAIRYLAALVAVWMLNMQCGFADGKDGIVLTKQARAKDLLASPNRPPAIVGRLDRSSVKVDGNFNWRANEKINDTIDGILLRVEDNWDYLVDGFDAGEYCTTFRHDMSIRNYSVAKICRMILIEALAYPYQGALPPTQGAWVRLSIPRVALGDEFAKWCLEQKRQGKPLWKLQVEMCDETIKSLAELDVIDTTKKECDEAIDRIRTIKQELQRTQKPKLPASIIISDFRMPITKEDAVKP